MDDKMNVMAGCIAWSMSHFGFMMLVLAAFLIILHRMIRRNIEEAEVVYRWVALFGLGFTGIYTFIMHVFYPVFTAATIGWQNSPFQYEVGMANLAVGVLGICSFRASYGFRLATVIAAICWLWGDAVGHIWQMIQYQNYTMGNAGSWFWMDVLIPMILLLCIMRLKRVN